MSWIWISNRSNNSNYYSQIRKYSYHFCWLWWLSCDCIGWWVKITLFFSLYFFVFDIFVLFLFKIFYFLIFFELFEKINLMYGLGETIDMVIIFQLFFFFILLQIIFIFSFCYFLFIFLQFWMIYYYWKKRTIGTWWFNWTTNCIFTWRKRNHFSYCRRKSLFCIE